MIRKIAHYRVQIGYFFIMILFSFGCVSMKKEAYLRETEDRKYEEREYEYILQKDDVVRVNISSITPSEYNFFSQSNEIDARLDPILSGFVVDKRGEIHLPVIGSVRIMGLTIAEAQEKVKNLASQYLDEPTVFIRLVNFKFTCIGEVRREGTYTIYEAEMNIMQAIGMAGGLTEFANREEIRLIRTHENEINTYTLNLLGDQILEEEFYNLHPGDIIIVYPLKTKNFRRNQSANIALIFSGIATIATIILAYDRIENN